ncbi:flagellar basal body rod protein FlgB [Oceanotoga sp. DSM 15011]|jgi:flagellar basal-body rod protein FlgB|uniref:flagellar basal body rod protein FlgB n=1 Tax=Oceanotoga TaxID=1255275 RepID=UPI0021F44A23|nr:MULTISPECIES: flagellar basal body rod protein FlgB [Oceanotoga]MDN5342056.1 flagellar basal-body rod protein FlgB [Oceanotoga sp.]MDO7975474.1 flagellar basal body rod protein FlgB [Oceanotoga teriensis]UYP00022.1 flagellar basal body rod protein FlgB [Oceanotoga sp. DSM 15011]
MFNDTFKILPKAMDASVLRHKMISQNLANKNTPNYKRKYVSFEEELNKSIDNNSDQDLKLNTNNSKHITNFKNIDEVNPSVKVDDSKSFENDGNNVDEDKEFSLMIQNSMKYTGLSRLMTYSIQRYNTAVRSGR